jgi:hypothetical protein
MNSMHNGVKIDNKKNENIKNNIIKILKHKSSLYKWKLCGMWVKLTEMVK